MLKIPPDNSIVTIKSHLYGTYMAACPDQKSIILQNVCDSKKLPQNCLWTLRRKMGTRVRSLRFISCYGRHLATVHKGIFSRDLGQDNPLTEYLTFCFAGWTYDWFGSTELSGGAVRLTVAGFYMCATEYGQVDVDYNYINLSTKPELYWTINQVDRDSTIQVIPMKPHHALANCPKNKEDENRGGGNMIIVENHVGAVYNNSTVNDSGKNINFDGVQQNGSVTAGNKSYTKTKSSS